MAHWMTRVARNHHIPASELPDLPGTASVAEAWARTREACGLTGADLAIWVAEAFRTKVADLSTAEPTALQLVPASVARRFGVFPLRDLDRSLEVATADPVDAVAEQEIAFASGRPPVLLIAPPEEISAAIDAAYSPEQATAALLARIESDHLDMAEVGFDIEQEIESVSGEEVASGPVVRLTNLVLAEAVKRGASDIHIQPAPRGGVVRFRSDGVLTRGLEMPLPVLLRVVSRIKIIGDLDIADRLRPQDGRARITIGGRPYDLRISTVPTRNAEKAVIRILDTQASTTMSDTGIDPGDLDRMRSVLGRRDGIFVVTGPTGSGKTTTLYAALRDIATEDVNIMTVEDPVEYELAGLTQIQVDTKLGMTFATALRAILRQDPDVIFVGEIRDAETAAIAVQASLTGHLVLATLHANDAIGTIRRFSDLGLDRATVAEVLRGSLAQRLVRRLCAHCAQPRSGPPTADEELLEAQLGVTPAMRSTGCEKCVGTGYAGRLPVTEFLEPTDRLVRLILEGATAQDLQAQAVADGMRTLLDSGRALVESGQTSLQEVWRVIGSTRVEAETEATAARPGTSGASAGTTGARSADATAHADSSEAADAGDTHILLVDDDGTVRNIARALLEKEGHRVSDVADGSEALARLARGERFSLMVLDLDMRMLGGRDVLRAVRSSLTTAALPVIVLTGTSDRDAEIELLRDGADDYIRKPIEPSRFVMRVTAALRRTRG
jgi:type II secretory ATPase GspE/PulE/Tfp pilus assembly ATPase PilB-like protein/ActR/RegA family two-component response regulator